MMKRIVLCALLLVAFLLTGCNGEELVPSQSRNVRSHIVPTIAPAHQR